MKHSLIAAPALLLGLGALPAVAQQSVLQAVLDDATSTLGPVSMVLGNIAESLGATIDNRVSVDVSAVAPGAYEVSGSLSAALGPAGALASAAGFAAIQAEIATMTVEIGGITGSTIGAVNTGRVFVGANSFDEAIDREMSAVASTLNTSIDGASAATASTTSATLSADRTVTSAVGMVGQAVGAMDPAGAVVMNAASNTADVLSGVSIVVSGAQLLARDITTTAIGAVNTGTISAGLQGTLSQVVSVDN